MKMTTMRLMAPEGGEGGSGGGTALGSEGAEGAAGGAAAGSEGAGASGAGEGAQGAAGGAGEGQSDSLLGKLYEDQILLYLAPDVKAPDDQFIIVMRAGVDPSIILVVIYTDIIDVDDNEWLDGVYIITDKELAEADEL